jgi:hypothetical protein
MIELKRLAPGRASLAWGTLAMALTLAGCASDGGSYSGVSTSVAVGVGYGGYYGPGYYGGYYNPYPPVVVVPPDRPNTRPPGHATTLPAEVNKASSMPSTRPATSSRPTSRPSPRPAPRPMPRGRR